LPQHHRTGELLENIETDKGQKRKTKLKTHTGADGTQLAIYHHKGWKVKQDKKQKGQIHIKQETQN